MRSQFIDAASRHAVLLLPAVQHAALADAGARPLLRQVQERRVEDALARARAGRLAESRGPCWPCAKTSTGTSAACLSKLDESASWPTTRSSSISATTARTAGAGTAACKGARARPTRGACARRCSCAGRARSSPGTRVTPIAGGDRPAADAGRAGRRVRSMADKPLDGSQPCRRCLQAPSGELARADDLFALGRQGERADAAIPARCGTANSTT